MREEEFVTRCQEVLRLLEEAKCKLQNLEHDLAEVLVKKDVDKK
jgi:hypothetical protein